MRRTSVPRADQPQPLWGGFPSGPYEIQPAVIRGPKQVRRAKKGQLPMVKEKRTRLHFTISVRSTSVCTFFGRLLAGGSRGPRASEITFGSVTIPKSFARHGRPTDWTILFSELASFFAIPSGPPAFLQEVFALFWHGLWAAWIVCLGRRSIQSAFGRPPCHRPRQQPIAARCFFRRTAKRRGTGDEVLSFLLMVQIPGPACAGMRVVVGPSNYTLFAQSVAPRVAFWWHLSRRGVE